VRDLVDRGWTTPTPSLIGAMLSRASYGGADLTSIAVHNVLLASGVVTRFSSPLGDTSDRWVA
jgi:hypothetical protein